MQASQLVESGQVHIAVTLGIADAGLIGAHLDLPAENPGVPIAVDLIRLIDVGVVGRHYGPVNAD